MKRVLPFAFALGLVTSSAFALDLLGGKSVGRMGTIELTAPQLRELLDAQPPEVRKALTDDPAKLRELIQVELMRRAVLAEARKAEWDKRPEVVRTLDRARDQALIDSYIVERGRIDPNYPAEKDIAEAYEANKAKFRVPPQLRLSQILLRVPERATKEESDKAAAQIKDIAAKLGKGGKFADLATLYSQDEQSKDKGGDVGWHVADTLQPQIRAEVLTLKPGEHTAPIRTAFGWQIVRLVEAKPETVRPLAEVSGALVKALRDARTQESRNKYLEALKARDPVAYDDKALAEFGKK